jgi:hypothetical protein
MLSVIRGDDTVLTDESTEGFNSHGVVIKTRHMWFRLTFIGKTARIQLPVMDADRFRNRYESLRCVRDESRSYACWSLSGGVKPAVPVFCILEFLNGIICKVLRGNRMNTAGPKQSFRP